MSNQNLSLLISRICSKKLYFSHDQIDYVLYSPDIQIRYEADIYYEQVLEHNKYEEWILQENITRFLNYIGVWNNEQENNLNTLSKEIDNTKIELFEQRLQTSKLKTIRKKLKTKKKIQEILLSTKSSMDYLTLEHFCNARKNEFMIVETLKYRDSNDLVCKDLNSFDHKIFHDLASCIANNFISVAKYKQIAKSEMWRSIWNSGKPNVFEGASSNFSDEQKTLVGLSNMYDRVYEHPESPSQEVIDDDDMLDGWMLYQKKKSDKDRTEKGAESLVNKHKNAKEIFAMSSKEDAQNINQLNSRESLNVKKQRTKIMELKGEVNEFDLPDVKESIRKNENVIQKRK